MKSPHRNSSKEAKALRIAAAKFAAHLKTPPSGNTDPLGQRLNADLLAAALTYAHAHSPLVKRAARLLGDVDEGLVDGSLMDNGVLEFLGDELRPVRCDLLGHKPHCASAYDCWETDRRG